MNAQDPPLFSFGSPSTPREPRRPTAKTEMFVLGVYPSALHVRWVLPEWYRPPVELKKPLVTALAVADEPIVFWDGVTPDPEELVAAWAAEWFKAGDDQDQWGHVTANGNGTSGDSVATRVLAPLGVDPTATWFTDAVNEFFVKRGTAKRPGQADRMENVYGPLARSCDLNVATIPPRPSSSGLVTMALTDPHRSRLLDELQKSKPPRIVTLGEEARRVLLGLGLAKGPPLKPLVARDFEDDPTKYGEAGEISLSGFSAEWMALVHPGQSKPVWRSLHDGWIERRHAEGQR